MVKISAAIITLNEVQNIADCIKSLHSVCDEIVVLDSNSTDNTVEIAKGLGAKIFYQDYLGDGPQKNKVAEYCSNDWVLSIDADERLDFDAISLLPKLQLEDRTGYAIKRKNFVGVRQIKAAGFYPNYLVRLYNKKYGAYEDKKAHAKIITPKVKKINCHLIHYTYKDFSEWLEKLNYFSTRDAWASGNKHVSNWYPVTHAVSALIRKLIFKGGLFSRDGWVIAMTTAIKTMFKYLKIQEQQHLNKQSKK